MTAPRPRYAATVTRVGLWWDIQVDGVGCTQARRLADVELMARELVAVTLDVPLSDVAVDAQVVGSQ